MSIDPITGIMVAASLAKGAMSFASSQQEEALLKDEAAETEIAALQDEADRRRELSVLTSANVAAAASGGRDTGVGSFLSIQEDNERIAALDIQNIRFMGRSGAVSLRRQATAAKLRGIGELVGSAINAGVTVKRGLDQKKTEESSGALASRIAAQGLPRSF